MEGRISGDMEQTVNLDGEKFEELLRCLSVIREHCNDTDIKEGVVRQRANENTSVFEIDMTSLLGDLTIPISGLKQKLDLLKIFSEQEVEITVNNPEDGNGWYSFSDQYSVLRFEMPDLDYMDNTFITEEEMENIFNLNDEDLVLSADISGFISDRMKIVAAGFNINTVQVDINGEEASISSKTQAGDQYAKFLEGIVTDKVLSCSSHMVITPFIIDHDGDIIFKMYNVQPNVAANKFTTTIADIDIRMFTRSTLIDASGEE
jgi:hypothetical protein